ncbi:MAG: hypothetical protein B6D55_02600 [Candidatus Omnitrophica bacterium 4484_70.2]|nr:MAG: hypothetical protein B6D55_02600 [Candidatus Omnitrophica bacterium 4484_70.2]
MVKEGFLLTTIVINIFLLTVSAVNLLKRKHIIDLLFSLSIVSLAVLEIGKFSFALNTGPCDKILGAGFCLTSLFWLIASFSFLPPNSYRVNRVILSPLLGMLSLVFFLIWWIKPFVFTGSWGDAILVSKWTRYFFILFILDLSLCISNLERSWHFLRDSRSRLLFISSLFLLIFYLFLAIYIVVFSYIHREILVYSSLGVFIGSILFLLSSQQGFLIEGVKEEEAVHTSLTLFLIGGYLFFIGAFIKIFQVFGWNLQVLFSSFTAFFIFFALLFLIFSSSSKERIKGFILRNLTRQRYDWQKIWEDFTYKISLVTKLDQIKKRIEESIAKIIGVAKVKVFIFDREFVFEEEFLQWLLRYAAPLSFTHFLQKNFRQKYPFVYKFFKEKNVNILCPLYGGNRIIGVIGISDENKEVSFLDKELIKVLSLQASGAVLNCWAYQRLQEMEKREAVYKVSSFVIHDVKNYINNLSLLVANKDKIEEPDFRKDAFFTLQSTIEKMRRLVEEFRTLRGELGIEKCRCSVREIIDETLKDIGIQRWEGVELVKLVEEDVFINADPRYIYKVIFNLLMNALEAMSYRGKLFIKTGVVDDNAYIFIRDTGKGMSQEFIENNLFKLFVSTKKRGMGIGLYQCKTIIEAHQGKIEVKSKLGEGTTFKIKLPLYKKSPDASTSWVVSKQQLLSKSKNCLVVDIQNVKDS